MNILNMDSQQMAGLSFDCSCGRLHSVDISRIIIGRDVLDRVTDVAGDFRGGRICLIADNNTYEACGREVEDILKTGSFDTKTFVFETTHPLVPDERTIGRLAAEVDRDTSLIVAVGSGTINDSSRFIAYKMGIPYIIVCSAPSMDGYASTVSPLIIDGHKVTHKGVYPHAIIGDTGVMKESPVEMLHAGFGDIIGKYTALSDWNLARMTKGEYHCKLCEGLVRNAIDKCTENLDAIAKRDHYGMELMMEALLLSGLAMGMTGSSRPASGAEHQLAHYWEDEALAKGDDHPLHGNAVGVGTLVTAMIYELVGQYIPTGIKVPSSKYIHGLLRGIGACDNPGNLGISKDLFKKSILRAFELRSYKYTVLGLAHSKGLLEGIADTLVGRFYK